jgi:glycosyltransferase involved in cell wall biosynthesis
MRVVMVAYAYYEGNRRIEQYANALASRGDQVDVIALNQGGSKKFETIDGVNLYRVQDRELRKESLLRYAFQVVTFMVRSFFFLTKKQFQNPYDVIHVHSVPDFLVFSALIPKLFGVPIILDIHDILPEFYITKFKSGEHSLMFRLLVLVERFSIAFSNYVIIANPIWRDRLIERSVKPEKVAAIWNYPNLKIFFPRPKTRTDGKFVLIYPGSLNWHQGLDIAIRAFALVVKEIPDAEFRIYGEGAERENLVKLTRELELDDKVLLSDFVPITEVASQISNADLAVVPKRAKSIFGTEAASTKIMEFMAVGVPVVVSRTKIDTLYHDDSTVQFFDSDDSNKLAKAIMELYAHPERRALLTANALEYVARNNWEAKKADYLSIVDGLVGKKVKAQHSEANYSTRN